MVSLSRVSLCVMLSVATSSLSSIQGLVIRSSMRGIPELQISSPVQHNSPTPPAGPMQQRIDAYFRDGAFPKAGRSLNQKIDEAKAFLKKEIPKTGAVGVGISVVYNDQVVISEGYGQRLSNDSSTKVSTDSLFQIGSVTKTFIGLAIGLLVEEGKLQWEDPVKQHMPWFQLVDKYAEAGVTIGNLLSMNSGLSRFCDTAAYAGAHNSSRALVEALARCELNVPFRNQPIYSNTNFDILGQLIEEVSGKPWDAFLNERVFKPLGMTHTFASVDDVPAPLRKSALNAGHYVCKGKVIGPIDTASRQAQLAPTTPRYAPGSVVSSAADMASFVRLMLNKGKVGNTTILKAPATIGTMITGRNIAALDFLQSLGTFDQETGLHYEPDGATLVAGYGIDQIGQLIWGRAYYEKGGDTVVHHAMTGFAPNSNLGVVILTNSNAVAQLQQCRSYVMGIVLDVPMEILDDSFKKWRAATDQLTPPFPGAPECVLPFWTNPTPRPLSPAESEALVGDYVSVTSSGFTPTLKISRGAKANEFVFEVALLKGTFVYATDGEGYKVFLPVGDHPLIFAFAAAAPTGGSTPGFYVQVLNAIYVKQTSAGTAKGTKRHSPSEPMRVPS